MTLEIHSHAQRAMQGRLGGLQRARLAVAAHGAQVAREVRVDDTHHLLQLRQPAPLHPPTPFSARTQRSLGPHSSSFYTCSFGMRFCMAWKERLPMHR